MNQKFLVINCDENDVEVLCQYLGGRQVVMCDSLNDVGRFLPSEQMAVLVPAAASAEEEEEEICAAHDESTPVAGQCRQELEQLVERIVEQNNGHSARWLRVDLLEQKIIEHSLQRNRQHRKETAAELGISRVTLYNKMKKFGLLD